MSRKPTFRVVARIASYLLGILAGITCLVTVAASFIAERRNAMTTVGFGIIRTSTGPDGMIRQGFVRFECDAGRCGLIVAAGGGRPSTEVHAPAQHDLIIEPGANLIVEPVSTGADRLPTVQDVTAEDTASGPPEWDVFWLNQFHGETSVPIYTRPRDPWLRIIGVNSSEQSWVASLSWPSRLGFARGRDLRPTFGHWTRRWFITAPSWFIVIVTGLLPIWSILKWRRAKQESRRQAGLCPSCGYDLRASPECCPECGCVTDCAPERPSGDIS
jgi:hypothetical protein